ncbi:MAG: hypothetical protein HOA24_02720 [Candidatus Pacebacteria bacterium]|nr:hypothetical protein [Candidatus Paceibacterota bacterium]
MAKELTEEQQEELAKWVAAAKAKRGEMSAEERKALEEQGEEDEKENPSK